MSERRVVKIVTGQPTSDGAGVRLTRVIGTQDLDHLDPFPQLDEFKSDRPDDYLASFPDHPHRGFETVTYLLTGSMRHQDHVGNRGELVASSVQWMTTGRGIHPFGDAAAEGRAQHARGDSAGGPGLPARRAAQLGYRPCQ